MATTFTQAKATLDEIAARLNGDRKKLEQAKALIAAADTSIKGLVAQYTQFVSDLNALATANPGDEAIQAAKAEKDRMVADRAVLEDRSDAMNTAVSGL